MRRYQHRSVTGLGAAEAHSCPGVTKCAQPVWQQSLHRSSANVRVGSDCLRVTNPLFSPQQGEVVPGPFSPLTAAHPQYFATRCRVLCLLEAPSCYHNQFMQEASAAASLFSLHSEEQATSGATCQPSCWTGVPPCDAHLHFRSFCSPTACSEVKCLGLYTCIEGKSTHEWFQVRRLHLAAPLGLAKAGEHD